MASGPAQQIKTSWPLGLETTRPNAGAGIGIMGREDDSCNSLLFQCSAFCLQHIHWVDFNTNSAERDFFFLLH